MIGATAGDIVGSVYEHHQIKAKEDTGERPPLRLGPVFGFPRRIG